MIHNIAAVSCCLQPLSATFLESYVIYLHNFPMYRQMKETSHRNILLEAKDGKVGQGEY